MHTYFNLRNWTPMVRAVRENPDDDTLKLALADDLEESGADGAHDRAELIRVSVELANMPPPFRKVTPHSVLPHDVSHEMKRYEKSGIVVGGRDLLKEVEVVRATFRNEELQGVIAGGVKPGDVLRIDRGPLTGRYGVGFIKVAYCEPAHTMTPCTEVYGTWYDFYKDENFGRRKLLEERERLHLNRVLAGHRWCPDRTGESLLRPNLIKPPGGLVYVNWHKGFPLAVHCSSSWWVNNAKQALDLEPFTELRVPFVPNIIKNGVNKYYWLNKEEMRAYQHESNTFPELFHKIYGAKLKIVETNTVRSVGDTTVIFTLTFTTTRNPAIWAPTVLHTYSIKQVFGYVGPDVYVLRIVGNSMPDRPGLWEARVTFELGRLPGLDAQYSHFEAHIPDLF